MSFWNKLDRRPKVERETINFKCPTNYDEAIEYIQKMKYCMDNPDTIDMDILTPKHSEL